MPGLLSAPTSARITSIIAEHAAEFTFLLPGDGRCLAEFTCRLSRRRNAHSRRRYGESGLMGRRVNLTPEALE
jgi:hypothetical protein